MIPLAGSDPNCDSEARERVDAAVFADASMQAGDPRGELLALELAASNTRDPIRARRIHRAAQVVRDRNAELAWPDLPELERTALRVRSGFVLALGPDLAAEAPMREGLSESPRSSRGQLGQLGQLFEGEDEGEAEADSQVARSTNASVRALARLLEHPAANQLRRIQLGSLAPAELDAALELLAARPGQLELLGLELSGPDQLDAISPTLTAIGARGLRIDYDRLTSLLLGAAQERISLTRANPSFPLRKLSLAGYVDPSPLAELEIDALDCWCRSSEDLAQIAALPRLRRLCLRHDDGLRSLGAASGLEALALRVGLDAQFEVLAELPALACLALHEPSGLAAGALAGLSSLTRLELRDAMPKRLDDLGAMSGLELLGLRGRTLEPGTLDLAPLAELPRLRSLILDLSNHTPRGCELLHPLRSLTVIGRVDLRWFAGTALDELTLTGGIPPMMLPRLSELGPLRRLWLPARILHGIDGVTLARLLPELEELGLFHASATLSPEQFSGFPRLRRLVVEGLDRARAKFFAEELPEIEIETHAPLSSNSALWDPLGLAAAFDWRGASWPRDIHGFAAREPDRS